MTEHHAHPPLPPGAKRWVAGRNVAGENKPSTDPISFLRWIKARDYLRSELGRAFMAAADESNPLRSEAMGEYVTASAILRRTPHGEPVTFQFGNEVWWIADLPE